MQINRYNYEEYFLLYTDNELNTQDREAVEEFVSINPDLKEDLALLQQYTLVPEELVFPDKSSLLKIADNDFIYAENYETCFLLYADNELNNHDRECVEQYVQDHPELQQAFELIGKAVSTPDDSIHFPNKESLLRHENEKVIAVTWWKMAAAAIVLLVAGALWLNNGSPVKNQQAIARQKNSDLSKQQTAAGNRKSVKSNAPVNQTPDHQASSADPEYAVAKKEAIEPKAAYLPDNKRKTDRAKQVAQLVNDHVRQVQSQVENTIDQVQAANNTAFNTISSAVIKNQQPVIDEAVTFSSIPDSENTHSEAIFASNNETNDVYVSNIPLDKKHALRGLFRKASRMINKATGINTGEKGILIGNIELALK